MTPPNTWTSGHVNRWHTNPCHALRNSRDSNHQHSARVALLLWHFWPDVSAETILSALMHDLPESDTGDIPGPMKRESPALDSFLTACITQWHEDNGTIPVFHPRISFCDKLDAILWAHSVDPALMQRDDWQACIDKVRDISVSLGVSDKLEEILG